jgi:hypothetical protein
MVHLTPMVMASSMVIQLQQSFIKKRLRMVVTDFDNRRRSSNRSFHYFQQAFAESIHHRGWRQLTIAQLINYDTVPKFSGFACRVNDGSGYGWNCLLLYCPA